jgi:ribosome-associated toxin RatA of RatAB toxin-antitoxin module
MADRTESSIVIASTPDVIMDVIADLEVYPEWSDGVKEVVVLTEYEDGRPAEARFRLESGPIKDTYELEYEWHGVRSVSWTLTQGQVLKGMDGTYALHDNGDGTTRVDYLLAVELSIPMIGMIKRKAEKVIVDTALKGLKKRVEG